MNRLWRIVDVEYNRVTEGLRVLEDLARFYWENDPLMVGCKSLRARLAGIIKPFRPKMLGCRDAATDPGPAVSRSMRADKREDLSALIGANMKRVQEGLRSLEEHLKLLDCYEEAKACEQARFEAYELEKTAATAAIRLGFPPCDIYGITAAVHSRGRSNLEVVNELLAAEVRVIQYREKDFSMRRKYRECVKIRELTAAHGAAFIVNDDVHLALAVEADGVHLGQDDLPVEKARELVGPRMLIGLSTHSPTQADAAAAMDVNYIGVGPIFATRTKKDVCAPVGLSYLDYVVKHHRRPFVAIGGIKQHNLAEVVRHGAGCVAMVTEIVGAPDIRAKIQALRAEMNAARQNDTAKDDRNEA